MALALAIGAAGFFFFSGRESECEVLRLHPARLRSENRFMREEFPGDRHPEQKRGAVHIRGHHLPEPALMQVDPAMDASFHRANARAWHAMQLRRQEEDHRVLRFG